VGMPTSCAGKWAFFVWCPYATGGCGIRNRSLPPFYDHAFPGVKIDLKRCSWSSRSPRGYIPKAGKSGGTSFGAPLWARLTMAQTPTQAIHITHVFLRECHTASAGSFDLSVVRHSMHRKKPPPARRGGLFLRTSFSPNSPSQRTLDRFRSPSGFLSGFSQHHIPSLFHKNRDVTSSLGAKLNTIQ